MKDDRLVLVTGATGFVGSRLVRELLARGKRIRVMTRVPPDRPPHGLETATGDMLLPLTLAEPLKGVDTAYYLVHSMSGGRAGFERRDREAAENFRAAADRAGVRRVIYLGGLGETGDGLSEHLASRLEVAQILHAGSFATTFLRAAVIIGAGSASFEMIRSLVDRLPLMITPRWVSTRCQPIGMIPFVRRSSMMPVLMMTWPCGATASTHSPSTFTCRPGAVARGRAVMRLMSPCSAAQTWPSPGTPDMLG